MVVIQRGFLEDLKALHPYNVTVARLTENLMAVYLNNSSTMIVFNQSGEVLKKLSIVPELALEYLKKTIKKDKRYATLFFYFMTDIHSETFLLGAISNKDKFLWYKFDTSGNLLKVLAIPLGSRIIGYGQGRYFCREKDDIIIYREES